MTSSEPIRVVLELGHNQRTICGRIAIDDTPRGDFYGWLELIDRLERATGIPGTERGEEDHAE